MGEGEVKTKGTMQDDFVLHGEGGAPGLACPHKMLRIIAVSSRFYIGDRYQLFGLALAWEGGVRPKGLMQDENILHDQGEGGSDPYERCLA